MDRDRDILAEPDQPAGRVAGPHGPSIRARAIAWGGALLAVVAAAGLWLTWWRAPVGTYVRDGDTLTDEPAATLPGTDLVGGPGTSLVVLAAGMAVVAAVRASGRTRWWWLAAAGVVPAAVAAAAAWSSGPSLGAAVTLVAGLLVLGTALVTLVGSLAGRARALPAAVLLLAVPAWFVPGVDARTVDAGTVEPGAVEYGRLELLFPGQGDVGGGGPLRGGTALPPSSGVPTLVPVDHAGGAGIGVAVPEGVLGIDGDRLTVLVRNEGIQSGPRPAALGIIGGRVVLVHDQAAEVWVLAPRTEPAVVTGVAAAGGLSPAGTLLVRSNSVDPAGPTLRRLDVTSLEAGDTVAAETLPEQVVPSTPNPTGALLELAETAVELPATDRIATTTTTRGPGVLLVAAGSGDHEWTVLAGGHDETCGVTSSGRDSFFHEIHAVAPAEAGGLWFAAVTDLETRLLYLSADGELRGTPPFEVGEITSLAEAADGALLVVSPAGLWRLPDPHAAVRALPAPAAGCAGHPVVGAPARLTPLETQFDIILADHSFGAWALDVHGRRIELEPGREVVLVEPGGARTTLGYVAGGITFSGWFVPDGAGGVWWTEARLSKSSASDRAGGGQTATRFRRLVHAPANGPVRRFAWVPYVVDDDDARAGRGLFPTIDLSGGTPLVGSCPLVRHVGGKARPLLALEALADCVRAVVGPDGRGWAASEAGLHAFDPSGAGPARPLIEASGGEVPVPVQLAHGVAPEDLSLGLGPVSISLDAEGRPLVLRDGVLLGLSDRGEVVVVAQDERLRGAWLIPVEGGTLVHGTDGTLFRLDH